MENYVEIHVLEGDQISQWIEQEGNLTHDQNFVPKILKHIKTGDYVIDIGAFCGDHTVAYSKTVGKEGHVFAFEPNHQAALCCLHNTQNCGNVTVVETALGLTSGKAPLSGNNGNYGGAYLGEAQKIADVSVESLDETYNIKPDFIKIDAEGCEPDILKGAQKMIKRCRPKMVIEVNSGALSRQGHLPEDIFAFLNRHKYTYYVMQENCTFDSPLYDIYCEPVVASAPLEEAQPEIVTLKPKIPPGATFLFRQKAAPAIAILVEFAAKSHYDRQQVVRALGQNDLHPRDRRKRDRSKKKK